MNEISFPVVLILKVKNHSAVLELEINVHVQIHKHECTLAQTYVFVHTCMHFQINGIISNGHIQLANHVQDIFQRNTSSHLILFTILELIILS